MQKLILLPGVGCDKDFWEYQIEHLSDVVETKVIVLDQQDTLDEIVEHVIKHVDKPCALAGHSLGGWASQAIAARYPDRFTHVFLMSTWTEATPEFWQAIDGFIARIENGELEAMLDEEIVPFVFPEDRLDDHELINRHQVMKKRMPASAYIRQLNAMREHKSVLARLKDITAKTLLIHGRQDINFALREQEKMLQHLQHGKLALIEDCGHMSCMERPQAVTALMRLWLSS